MSSVPCACAGRDPHWSDVQQELWLIKFFPAGAAILIRHPRPPPWQVIELLGVLEAHAELVFMTFPITNA